MPWTPKDAAGKTKKANSPKKRRQWSKIANKLLKSGVPEGKAIQEASGTIKRLYGGKDKK